MSNIYIIIFVWIACAIYGADRRAMAEAVPSDPKVSSKVEIVLFDGLDRQHLSLIGKNTPLLFITAPNGIMCDTLGRRESDDLLKKMFIAMNDSKDHTSGILVTVGYDADLSFSKVIDAIRRLVIAATSNVKREKKIRIYLVVEQSKETVE